MNEKIHEVLELNSFSDRVCLDIRRELLWLLPLFSKSDVAGRKKAGLAASRSVNYFPIPFLDQFLTGYRSSMRSCSLAGPQSVFVMVR